MLDIDAFSNAMRAGSVPFLRSLGLAPFADPDGAVVSFRDDDAVVFPMGGGEPQPSTALRLPLDAAGRDRWPAQYADLATMAGSVADHVPSGITMIDVDRMPGIDVALLYDWVPGETLTARVTQARVRQERDRLVDLLWPLADLAEALRLAGMVHGDIAPGNIVVRPDGGMTLIDLDRMGYRADGGALTPRRRPGYRIPRGGGDAVEEDGFALLVLLASCAVLADASVPIDHERAPAASHPMLLFSSWDLMDPRRSRLVREVEGELTPLAAGLLEMLVDACSGATDRIPVMLRDAVRLVRRSVSPPDGAATIGDASTDWTPVTVEGMEAAEPEPAREDSWASAWEPKRRPEATNEIPDEIPGRVDEPDTTWPEQQDAPAERKTSPVEPEKEVPSAPPERTVSDASTADLLALLGTIAEDVELERRSARRSERAERRRQVVRAQLQEALAHNDRELLVRLAMSGALAELGESRRSDLLRVVRALAHDQIERAVATDDDGVILAAVDDRVFEQDRDLDPAFRDRVRLARTRQRWVERMLEAVRADDGETCSLLFDGPPEGGVDRLPLPVRRRASALASRHDAVRDVEAASATGDAAALEQALGRLVTAEPLWTDFVEPGVVLRVLDPETLEARLAEVLAAGPVKEADQWLADLVIAAGRLPAVTRRAGIGPREAAARLRSRELVEAGEGERERSADSS